MEFNENHSKGYGDMERRENVTNGKMDGLTD